MNPEQETHVALNKSISIEGVHEKTIIDGNNTALYFDVAEENKSDSDGPIVIRPIDFFDLKNNGNHITFKNITFKDLNMISHHEMEFIDCKFIKTKFITKELNNTFLNCIFNESNVEFSVYDIQYKYDAKIINCTLYSSQITSQTYIAIELVGSDRIFYANSIELTNLNAFDSDILLNHYNVNVTNSKFNNTNLRGSSDRIDVFNSSFNHLTPTIYYSDINFEQTDIINSNAKFFAGYYARGCEVSLKNSFINSTTLELQPGFYSSRSKLKIDNSSLENSEIKSVKTDITINDSNFNKSGIELFYCTLDMNGTVFYSNGNLADTIKTKTEREDYIADDGNFTLKNVTCEIKTDYNVENSYLINGSGKYEINNGDINANTLYQLSYNLNIPYYINDNITFNVKDHNGNAVSDFRLFFKNPNDNFTLMLITDENGNANYTLNRAGELNLTVYYERPGIDFYPQRTYLQVNLTVNPKVLDMKLIKDFKSNTYSKINSFLKVKIISNCSDLKDIIVTFKVYSGKKWIVYAEKTASNGVAVFKIPAMLDAGVHKIQVIADNKVMKTSIKIDKARTIVKAPKVANKFKKSKYFKLTIKNKETKKLLSNVKVKIKVFTGKKFKTFTVETNKKGLAKINTKTLKAGKHKVIVSSGNNNYKISAKSLITIKN